MARESQLLVLKHVPKAGVCLRLCDEILRHPAQDGRVRPCIGRIASVDAIVPTSVPILSGRSTHSVRHHRNLLNFLTGNRVRLRQPMSVVTAPFRCGAEGLFSGLTGIAVRR